METAGRRTGAGAVLAIALFAFAVLLGFASNGVLDQGRAVGLDAVDWASGWENPTQLGIGFFVGLLGAIFLGLAFVGWVERRISTGGASAAMAVIGAGWTIGLLMFLPWIATPQHIGESRYSVIHPQIWGVKEWAFYAAPVALPLVGLVLTIVFAGVVLLRYRRRTSDAGAGGARSAE